MNFDEKEMYVSEDKIPRKKNNNVTEICSECISCL